MNRYISQNDVADIRVNETNSEQIEKPAIKVYAPKQYWTNKEKRLFRGAFIFVIAFALPLDAGFYNMIFNFDYAHLNYRQLTEIVAFFNPQFFNIFSESGFFGIASYINIPFILLLAILGSWVWGLLDKRSDNYNRLYYWLRVLARYRVAYGAIGWGYKKIFIMQMPSANVGLLHTEFIDFFAKRLYWESIGVATKYEFFLGMAEFLGGFLLLFRKTTPLGAALAFVVFGNIAIANHAYDIGEAVPSAGMAMLALFVLWQDLPPIWNLLAKQVDTKIIRYYPVFTSRWQKYAKLTVKWAGNFVFVILFFVFEVYAYTHNDFYKLPNTPGLANAKGYYNVTEFKLNNKVLPYSPDDSIRWHDATFEDWSSLSFKVANRPQEIEMFAAGSYPKRGEVYDNKLHFNWRGDIRRYPQGREKHRTPEQRDLNITWEQSGVAGRMWYYYKADTINKILYLQNKNKANRDQKQVLHYDRPTPSRIILWGTNEYKDSIYVVLDKLNKNYPLKTDRSNIRNTQ